MTSYLARRVLWALVTIFVVVSITWLLFHILPSDPARTLAGPHAQASAIRLARIKLGLDKPLIVQYLTWLGQLVHGNLGWDWVQNQSVDSMLASAIPTTFYLAVAGVILELAIGIPIGVVAAKHPGGFLDGLFTTLNLSFYSMPTFWLGSMLLLFLGFKLSLFPLDTCPSTVLPLPGSGCGAMGLVLPGLTVGLAGAAVYSRLLRATMLDVDRADYVRTARAKGLAERTVTIRHILRNALLPLMTYFGLDLAAQFGGLILVEVVFAWTGVGYLFYIALNKLDGSFILGDTIFITSLIIVANMVVDLLYTVIDPEITYQ